MVLVGAVKKNPVTVVTSPVKAVLVVPELTVKVEVAYFWEVVAIGGSTPETRVELAESRKVVDELPALVPVAFWLVPPVVLDAAKVP